jgi:hypothetical protein
MGDIYAANVADLLAAVKRFLTFAVNVYETIVFLISGKTSKRFGA